MFQLLFLTLLQTSRCDHRRCRFADRILTLNNPCFLPVKNDRKEQGFSILEILVTILVITGFILGSVQTIVLATFMRVQAQDKQEATNWIQQDLELIRYQAFILDGGVAVTSTCDSSSYGSALNTVIGSITNPVKINDRNYTVTRTPSNKGNILQITYNVEYAPASGSDPAHPRYKSTVGADNVVTILSTEVLPNAALGCN